MNATGELGTVQDLYVVVINLFASARCQVAPHFFNCQRSYLTE
jgi:hypothetical protein